MTERKGNTVPSLKNKVGNPVHLLWGKKRKTLKGFVVRGVLDERTGGIVNIFRAETFWRAPNQIGLRTKKPGLPVTWTREKGKNRQ